MFGRPNGTGNHPVNRLREEMDHLFENIFGGVAPATPYSRGYPALNVWEDENSLFAEAEVPGMTMEQLEVYVIGNELTIKGERRAPEGQNAFHRRERSIGQFARTISLPIAIDVDKVEASLRDGVLMVRMPKAEAAKPRKIEVRAS